LSFSQLDAGPRLGRQEKHSNVSRLASWFQAQSTVHLRMDRCGLVDHRPPHGSRHSFFTSYVAKGRGERPPIKFATELTQADSLPPFGVRTLTGAIPRSKSYQAPLPKVVSDYRAGHDLARLARPRRFGWNPTRGHQPDLSHPFRHQRLVLELPRRFVAGSKGRPSQSSANGL
jgi:hypothetical protein